MAADPRSYLTAGIIIGVFSLVALFGGIAIPLIEKGKLYDTITNDQMLTREQSLAWATVPGTRNISYQKTFTFFNLTASSDDILQGKVDAQPLMNATYDYTYQYSKLQFTPGTNGSVQYFNIYNHTYLGANETDLANLQLNTINMGMFRGINQLANMNPAQIFVQSMHRIYTSFQDIYIALVCDYLHDFYIQYKDLTYQTIFLYNGTVTQAQADQLWSDPQYGWNTTSTLLPWVTMAMNYGTNPSNSPLYIPLKNRFGLTDTQMMALVGYYMPGQATPSSMLYLLTVTMQSTISGVNNCSLTSACTTTELFGSQMVEASLTKNPAFKGVSPKDSIADLNKTFPCAPEITAVNPQNVYFGLEISNALFGLYNGNPTADQQSLFNIVNVEFILANQNNPQAIANYSSLDNAQQGQILVDYVNYILNQFTYQGQSNLQPYKFMVDSAVQTLNTLPSDMANLLSINLTALGTYNLMKSQGYNCTYLLQNVSLSQDLITTVCADPDYTLDTPHGQASYVAAYFANDGSSVWNTIESATGIPDPNLATLVTNSLFSANVQTILGAIATSVGCLKTPCAASDLSSLQWSTSGVTTKLPTQYFTPVESMVDLDIFKVYFGNFIPEFPVSANRNQGLNLTLTSDQGNTFFNYDVGSLNNNYELFKLVAMYQNANYTGIQSIFNLTQPAVGALLYYFDSAFLNYYLKSLSHQISAYELLWGYSSDFLTNLNNANFFDTIQSFVSEVSLYGSKDNSDESSDAPFNMIDSGSDNSNNVRQMTNYNGNGTLSINYTYFNGNYSTSGYQPVWSGSLQYVSGSDGTGFSPLLNEDDSIAIFEGPFLRTLNYNYQTQITKDSYDFNQYQLDTSQLAASSIFLNNADGYMNLTGFDSTPVVVSLPYFKACASNSYSSITFNNQPAANYQPNVDPGTITVETLTGLTDSFTKSYQYNAYNYMPFFTKATNLAAIPLFQVTETFTTPQSNYNSDLQSYYSSLRGIKIAMIVVLVFAFLLMVTSGVMLRMYFVNRKKLDASRLNANPGDYASLGVDSDGARSSLHPLTQGER